MIKKNIFRTALIASVLLTSSCSFFNPKYEKPKIKTPALWNSQSKAAGEVSKNWDLTKIAWWRGFDDPTLNNLVTTALKDNNKIQVAIGNVLQAQAEVNKADYGWLPTASVGGGGFIAQTFDTNSSVSVPNVNPPSSNLFGGSLAGVIPSYTINIVREFQLGKISRFSEKSQRIAVNATRLTIITQVTGAYFSLITAKEQLKLQNQLIHRMQTLYYYAKRQHQLGASSPLIPEMIKQQLEAQKGKAATIKNDITHFNNTLKLLTGRNPGQINTTRTLDQINANIKNPVNLPSQVLENRPDISIAEYKLKIANGNIGLARSQFFPSIDLTGTFGNATLALGQLATFNAWAWAAEAVAAVPIFNLSIMADSDKAKSQFYQAYYDYINTLQKAFEDVDNDLSQRTADKENYNKLMVSLESTKMQERILKKKYQLGAISKAQYLGIYLNVLNQQMQANQAKLKSLISISNLYQSLGAGYNVDNYDNPHMNNPAFSK